MQIVVDIDDPEPLFAQLVGQVKQVVTQGSLKPGDALPSIRQLANDLALNSKTVAKAYRLLERDGVIQTRGYRGTFIHTDAKSNCDLDLNQWVTDKLNELLVSFKESGVTDSEIRIAFNNVINSRTN
jgi:GntR family transcriptional regulator